MRKAHIVPIEQQCSGACRAAVAMHSSSKAEFFSGIETDGASASITLKDSALKLLCIARSLALTPDDPPHCHCTAQIPRQALHRFVLCVFCAPLRMLAHPCASLGSIATILGGVGGQNHAATSAREHTSLVCRSTIERE